MKWFNADLKMGKSSLVPCVLKMNYIKILYTSKSLRRIILCSTFLWMWWNNFSVFCLSNLLHSDFQTIMENFHLHLPPCLRWFSKCIGGLPPQQHWLKRWWPCTKGLVKFHPVQLMGVRTVILQPLLNFACFSSTKPESVMPSGNLLHPLKSDKCYI